MVDQHSPEQGTGGPTRFRALLALFLVGGVLGYALARLTITVAFEELLARVRGIRPARDAEVTFTPGLSWRPIDLRVAFDRA